MKKYEYKQIDVEYDISVDNSWVTELNYILSKEEYLGYKIHKICSDRHHRGYYYKKRFILEREVILNKNDNE